MEDINWVELLLKIAAGYIVGWLTSNGKAARFREVTLSLLSAIQLQREKNGTANDVVETFRLTPAAQSDEVNGLLDKVSPTRKSKLGDQDVTTDKPRVPRVTRALNFARDVLPLVGAMRK